jgi:hypothetical protein
MKTRTAQIVLVGLFAVLLTAGGALATNLNMWTETFQALGPTPAYQFSPGPPPSAIFTNLTGDDVVGLKLTFTAAVPSLSGYGVGANATLASNAGLMAVFEGDISDYGGVYAQWDETAASVLVAQWLLADGSSVPVDLHQPLAKMVGSVDYGQFGLSVSSQAFGLAAPTNGPSIRIRFSATFSLDGSRSTTFDNNDIVRYQWEWHDGLVQEGPTAERTIRKTLAISPSPGLLSPFVGSVTLTVWSANGASSSVTKAFSLRPLRVPF